jgi:hypothetical protein
MTDTIQTVKEDIAILQEKLKKLEELDRVKTPAEEAFYRIYSRYPDKLDDRHGSLWNGFITGYDLGYVHATKDAIENNKNFEPTPQEQENNEWRNVALRFGEELVSIGPCGYDDMTANDWLEWAKDAYGKNCDGWLKLVLKKQRKYEALTEKLQEKTVIEPTPQTPEQVEQGLRDAMKQAKEDGVFEKPKPKTLYDVIYEWKYDTYDPTCDLLVDMIEEWLPDEFDPNDSVYEYEIGWNEAIQAIKDKLK